MSLALLALLSTQQPSIGAISGNQRLEMLAPRLGFGGNPFTLLSGSDVTNTDEIEPESKGPPVNPPEKDRQQEHRKSTNGNGNKK
jgi:hypothetical protein